MAQKDKDDDKNGKEDGFNFVSDISHRREGCKRSEYPGAVVTVFCAHNVPCVTADDDILRCRCANPDPISGQDLQVKDASDLLCMLKFYIDTNGK